MNQKVKPSIDEAFVIQEEGVALDFIGKRGSKPGVTREKRMKYAKDILQKELLPHFDVSSFVRRKRRTFLATWSIVFYRRVWVVVVRMIVIIMETSVWI